MALGLFIAPVTLSVATAAGGTSNVDTAVARQVAQGTSLINYAPPDNRGAPKTRIGGGTRSLAASASVEVLAPDHTGHTSSASPTLYWVLEGAAVGTAVVTVIAADAMDPILEVEVPIDAGGAVQMVDLAGHGVSLAPNVDYEWSVSIVTDDSQRSLDAMAGGAIRYVPPSTQAASRIGSTDGIDRAVALAETGYWYDAMAVVHGAYTSGRDARAREAAIALLRQVGLDRVTKAY